MTHEHQSVRWYRKFLPASIQPIAASLDTRAWGVLAGVAIVSVAASLATAPRMDGALASGLALVAIAIAVVDARSFIIPDELNIAGFVLGLACAGYAGAPVTEAIALAALRGLVLALVFAGVRAAYQWLRGRQGIGLGDVKLAAVAGVWLDWLMIPIAVQLAAVTALGVYLGQQFATGRSFRSTSRLPFGLFFAPAIWSGWMLDQWLIV